jgi:hypothetical protein
MLALTEVIKGVVYTHIFARYIFWYLWLTICFLYVFGPLDMLIV